jgi:hypothetical protein
MRAVKVSGRKSPPSPRITTKDIVATSIAVLSLLISATLAYFTVLRQADDLRAVVNAFPWLTIDSQRNSILVSGSLDMHFINAGPRPAAILAVTLPIYDGLKLPPEAGIEDKSICAAPKIVATDLEPFVLKEKEIAQKKARMLRLDYTTPTGTSAEEGSILFPLPPISREHPEYRAQLVLCVRLATPSDADAYGTVDLNEISMRWNGGSLTGGIAVEKKPQQIWYRRLIVPWND